MPSVFFISTMNSASWGGSEMIWYHSALLALRENWKVACAVYDWPGKEERLQILERNGAIIYRLPNKGVKRETLLDKIQFKITKRLLLKKAIRSLPFAEYEIAVINLGEFEITHRVWADLYKRLGRFILIFHNYKEKQQLKPPKAKIMQSWVDKAQLNLFDARRIIEVLEKNSGIKIPNGDVLLNPLSFPIPTRPFPYPPLHNGKYRFIMLAALDVSRKAQDNLAKALSSEKWKGRNWTLYLYGDGKDKGKLERLIQEKGMTDKIFLEGHTNNVKSALEYAHLLFQITHVDAMPLVVVEAMAMGRAAAVSKIGDMPHWVKENKNGWVSNDASVDQIDITLERAWQQREQWGKMGENAFAIFQKKYPASAEEILLDKINVMRKK